MHLHLQQPQPCWRSPGSATCEADQKVVAGQQAKILAFEHTRNSSLYQGQGQIIYTTTLKEMQNTLAGFEASETIACSSTPFIGSGQVFPKYSILTVVYAPPGTAGGKSSSLVDYSSAGSVGSTINASSSFKTDYSVTVSATVGSGGNSATASLGDDWTAQQTTTTDYKVTNTIKNEIKVPGPAADGIDHGYDQIWLCLNPMITLQVEGNKITYTPGIASSPMQQIYVYVSELKTGKFRSDVAQTLNSKGFTSADYAAILKADPFANGSTYIQPSRFIETSSTCPYEPPLTANDQPTVCSLTVTNDSQSSVTTANSASNALTVSASVSVGFSPIASATVSTKDSWTWTQTNSVGTTSLQSAPRNFCRRLHCRPLVRIRRQHRSSWNLLGYHIQFFYVCSH